MTIIRLLIGPVVRGDVNSRARAVAPRNDSSSRSKEKEGEGGRSVRSIFRYRSVYHSRSRVEGRETTAVILADATSRPAGRCHPDGRRSPVAIRVSLRCMLYDVCKLRVSQAPYRVGRFCANENRDGRGWKKPNNRYRWREGRFTTGAGHASARIKSWEYSAPSSAIYEVGRNQISMYVRVIPCRIPCTRWTM